MNQVIQTCTYKGHEQNKVKYACIDSKCEVNRMLCSQCLLQNIHKHGNENNSNILDHEGVQQLIHLQLNKLREQKHKGQDICNHFVQRTILCIKKIQDQIQKIVNILKQLQDYSFYANKINCLDEKILSIKNQKLNQIDNYFMKSQIANNLEQSKLPQIELINNEWDNIIKTIQSSQQLSELWNQQKYLQTPNLKVANYTTTLIDQSKYDITAATQSNDLKYIVLGEDYFILKIWDYSTLKLITQKELDDCIRSVKFTDDSQFLYVGMLDGVLYCFDVKSNFQQTYKQQIHDKGILNFYCLSNTIILTVSQDKTIIKTDISLNQQIFVIKAHDDYIYGLDYHKLKNIIVSCSDDKSIKLWDNSDGSLIIEKQNAHCQISDVFFVFDNDQLLSLDNNKVINIWQIRYDNKEIIPIKSITDSNNIYNISLVNNQQIILLNCSEYIKFYSIQGEYIRTIKHDVKEFYMFNTTQLVSGKSIIIQGKRQLAICRIEQ